VSVEHGAFPKTARSETLPPCPRTTSSTPSTAPASPGAAPPTRLISTPRRRLHPLHRRPTSSARSSGSTWTRRGRGAPSWRGRSRAPGTRWARIKPQRPRSSYGEHHESVCSRPRWGGTRWRPCALCASRSGTARTSAGTGSSISASSLFHRTSPRWSTCSSRPRCQATRPSPSCWSAARRRPSARGTRSWARGSRTWSTPRRAGPRGSSPRAGSRLSTAAAPRRRCCARSAPRARGCGRTRSGS
jgi:hypothetical protein